MKRSLLTLSAVMLTASLAPAVTLASYDFTAGSLASTAVTTFGTASDITLGSTWEANVGNGNLERDMSASGPGQDINGAANMFSFTFTVSGLAANERLVIDDVFLDYVEAGTTNTIRHAFFLDSTNVSGQIDPLTSSGTLQLTSSNPTFASPQFANGDSFTLAYSQRDNINGTSTADNFILQGSTVAIPEPSSTALIGLGFCGLLLRRKRS